MTPHTPRPAPRAMTRVWSTSIALLKNAISSVCRNPYVWFSFVSLAYKSRNSLPPWMGGPDSGVLLFQNFVVTVRFVRHGLHGRQLRRIDKITPFTAEHHSLSAASISYTSQTSLGWSFNLVDRKRSMSKAFFPS